MMVSNYLARVPVIGRNVLTLVAGGAGAQAISFMSIPIITRLYTPEMYGMLGIFVVWISFLTPIVALSYPSSLILPKSKFEALSLAVASLLISLVVTVLLSAFFLIYTVSNKSVINPDIVWMMFILLPSILILAAYQVSYGFLLRNGQYTVAAGGAIAQSLLSNGVKLMGGLLSPSAIVLMAMTSLGYLSYVLYVGIRTRRGLSSLYLLLKIARRPAKVMKSAKSYSDFALYRTPQLLLNSTAQGLPVIYIAVFHGAAAAGFYTLAKSAVAMPCVLIGKSVTDVLYPRMAQFWREGRSFLSIFLKGTFTLAAAGAVPAIAIYLYGPSLFSLVFGHDWKEAGLYAGWISLWFYAFVVARPSVAAIPILGMQKLHLIFESLGFIVRGGVLAISYIIQVEVISFVIMYATVGILMNMTIVAKIMSVTIKARQIKR